MKKRWWGKLPYWLKGGIIGLIISLILRIYNYFYLLNANTYTDCIPGPCYTGNLFNAIFYSPGFYFIIIVGILIGFIYGIIKSKMGKKKK